MKKNKELRKAVKKAYAYYEKADVSVQDVNRLLKFEGFDYYEVAKLAKEKGFDVPTAKNYRHESGATCNAPTQSLLQRWLREKKGVVFGISPMQEMDCEDLGWCATIYKVDENGYGLSWKEELYYNTYELALENALKYALENLV